MRCRQRLSAANTAIAAAANASQRSTEASATASTVSAPAPNTRLTPSGSTPSHCGCAPTTTSAGSTATTAAAISIRRRSAAVPFSSSWSPNAASIAIANEARISTRGERGLIEDGEVVDRVAERARVQRDRERHHGQTGEEQLRAARAPRHEARGGEQQRQRAGVHGALGEVGRPASPRIPQYRGKNSALIDRAGSGGCDREELIA